MASYYAEGASVNCVSFRRSSLTPVPESTKLALTIGSIESAPRSFWPLSTLLVVLIRDYQYCHSRHDTHVLQSNKHAHTYVQYACTHASIHTRIYVICSVNMCDNNFLHNRQPENVRICHAWCQSQYEQHPRPRGATHSTGSQNTQLALTQVFCLQSKQAAVASAAASMPMTIIVATAAAPPAATPQTSTIILITTTTPAFIVTF